MIISINQPAYLPWLGYFNRIVKSDLHIVLDHVQFEKNSFINRNKILNNAMAIWLSIPVLTKGKFCDLPINQVRTHAQLNWRRKHWFTIYQAYAKKPYWSEIENSLNIMYQSTSDLLKDILNDSLSFFLQYLSIKTPILYSSHYHFKNKKSDLVLDICRYFGATEYLSGPLGRDYLELEKFQKQSIKVTFDDYIHPVYLQGNKPFIPHLSCIDLIANEGKNSLKVLTHEKKYSYNCSTPR